MKFILPAFFTLIIIFPVRLSAQEAEMCVIAEEAILQASKIRGLKTKKKVPCEVHGKDLVRKYILSAIKEQLPQQKLEMEELTYRTIGLIPKDFNYQDGLIELYLSQLGGYYDPEKKYFVMAGWMPAIMQNTIAVHELTHALQDMYFDLEPFVNPMTYTTDQILARMALVEGDATAVMMDYTRALLGQQPLAESKDVEGIMMQNVLSVALVAGAEKVPQSLKTILIFPYTSGLRFAHQLIRKGGYKSIDRAFKNPPDSTEQVLHPEKYFAGKKDYQEVTLESLKEGLAEPYEVLHEDRLGEFTLSALLGMYVKEGGAGAAEAAAGWAGDRVAVFENSDSKQRKLIWKIAWDSEKDAKQFFEAYRQVLQSRESDLVEAKNKVHTSDKKISFRRDGLETTLQVTVN